MHGVICNKGEGGVKFGWREKNITARPRLWSWASPKTIWVYSVLFHKDKVWWKQGDQSDTQRVCGERK